MGLKAVANNGGGGGGGGSIEISAGTNAQSTGTVNFVNSNGVSFGLDTTGNLTASVAAAAGFGLSAGSQSVSTGTVVFSNSNGVSFGMSGSSRVTASVAAQTNQTVGLFAVSNTTQSTSATVDARSLSFGGAGIISVGATNGSIVISAAAAGGLQAVYDGANSISSGTVSFANANGVTFSVNAQTLSASVAAQSNQTLGVYALGRTNGGASSSTFDARSLSFNAYSGIAGNIITIGIGATNAVNPGFNISASYPSINGPQIVGGGITSSVVITGGNNITVTANTVGGVNNITISGPNQGFGSNAMQLWQNSPPGAGLVSQTMGAGTMQIYPLDVGNAVFPGDMTINTVLFNIQNSNVLGGLNSSVALTFAFGLYSVSASSTLALINSGSTQISFAATQISAPSGIANQMNGPRWLTMAGTNFSGNSLTLTNGLYYGAIFSLTGNSNIFTALSMLGNSLQTSGSRSGTFGTGSASNATNGWNIYGGQYSATTNAFPASININQITRTVAGANFVPMMMFNNLLSVF